ncbi:MAG: vitamin K epoxide reductase family protein [Acidobacteria bacterium]|nr:vitamin K epoxide reductase family protein [Acidobacteriota bacterium]
MLHEKQNPTKRHCITLSRRGILAALALLAALAAMQGVPPAKAETPVVRAVLFTSPTCGHCARVRQEVLPPLAARYGPQLQVAIVSTASPNGQELFLAACMKHGLLQLSVPMLVVGNKALVGSLDIPNEFPGLIETHLASGGVDWPAIPGLRTMLASAGAPPAPAADSTRAARPAPEPPAPKPAAPKPAAPLPEPVAAASAPPAVPRPSSPAASTATAAPLSPPGIAPSRIPQPDPAPAIPPPNAEPQPGTPVAEARSTEPPPPASGIIDLTGGERKPGVLEKILRDPYGNGLSILVLLVMIAVVLASPKIAGRARAPHGEIRRPRLDALIPLLVLAGFVVAGYLSIVEVREVEAVCGPVGDCNTVQQSAYAKLFGVLPIGLLGLGGFLAILAAWVLRRWGPAPVSVRAAVALLVMTAFGVLFSIYLTFLEPFVIGATCLWCLSSATIMTLLFLLTLGPGTAAWTQIRKGPGA